MKKKTISKDKQKTIRSRVSLAQEAGSSNRLTEEVQFQLNVWMVRAAETGDFRDFMAAIDAGADIHYQSPICCRTDIGRSMTYYAIRGGNI